MYALAPYCEVLRLGEVIHVGFGSIGMAFATEREKAILFDILAHLASHDTFDSFLAANERDDDILGLVRSMVDHHILVPLSEIPAYNRHHREQLFFLLSGGTPSDVMDRLFKKRVAIVGCGGIGCLAAYTLVTAGARHIVLMDADIVEIHNISRQFAYDETDIGKKKVTILREQLLKRNSAATVVAIDQRAVFSDDYTNIPDVDFVLLAADEPGIIQKANKCLVKKGIPFLHVCYINDIATWGPLVVPGQTGCWACQTHIGSADWPEFPSRRDLMREINSQYVCPVISPVSTSAVALATLDVIRFLGEFAKPASRNRRIGLWTHDLHFEYQDFSRSLSCEICGHQSV